MTNPFDDPEFRRQLEAAGVVHAPGMAAEMLREFAPLLASEGIDMDDLGTRSLDDVNAALDRAVERHNMALSTPIGAQRDNAFAVLRGVAAAVIHEDDARADTLLATVTSDPHGPRPSAAQVMGVAADTLDEWLGRRRGIGLSGMKFPAWPSAVRAAATEVLSQAKAGRAFDSLTGIIARHGGRVVLWGAALAVASVARTRVAREGVSVDELLPGGEIPAVIDTSEFEAWLADTGADDPAGEAEYLRAVAERVAGLDLDDPESVEAFVLDLTEDGLGLAEDVVDSILDVLHDYVEFRVDDDDSERWALVFELFDDASVLGIDTELLATAVRVTSALSPGQRLSALRATRPVGAVSALVEWLGASRAVSQTGAVRRADIEAVAGMLGVDARGVAKRPPYDESSTTRFVTSMRELPILDAWWQALSIADVIEITATRVRPGPVAARDLDVETAERLLVAFVGDLLLQQYRWWRVGYDSALWALIGMLDEDESVTAKEALANGWVMRILIESDIVVPNGAGEVALPVALHAPVAMGIVLAQKLLQAE